MASPPANQGHHIETSPCTRYRIHRAPILTFPTSAIINIVHKSSSPSSQSITSELALLSGPDLASTLSTTHPSGIKTGDAISTSSFALPNCKYIIHTSAPSFRRRHRGNLPLLRQLLSDCYRRCLEEAVKLEDITTIAFPAIGIGSELGWSRNETCRIGVRVVARWFGHPIEGKERRERIPGPVYFLTNPEAGHTRLEWAWIEAFVETFPGFHRPSPRNLELLARSFDRVRFETRARYVAGKLERDGTGPEELRAHVGTSRLRRIVGQRELRGLQEGTLRGTEPVAGRGNPRVRRPPKRYGQ